VLLVIFAVFVGEKSEKMAFPTMGERDFKGVWIPKELWLTKDLSPIEKFFLLEIDSLDNDDGCFASNAHFSELFGVTKGRCTQIIKGLECKKLINVELQYKGKMIYKRTIKVVNKLNTYHLSDCKKVVSKLNTPVNKLNTNPPKPNEKVVNKLNRGSENIKQGYLENAQGNNTSINNTNKTYTPVEQVFNYWQKALNHPRAKLGDDRKKIISKILKTYSVDELKIAINGVKKDDWADRNKFDDFKHIFSGSANIDKFINLAEGQNYQSQQARFAHEC